jgi:ribosomal-protein-alanine N-acetyltransferase
MRSSFSRVPPAKIDNYVNQSGSKVKLNRQQKTVYNPLAFAYDATEMSEVMKDLVICPMTESDLERILAIEVDSYRRPWSKPHFLDEIKSPHSFPLVAFDQEGMLTGYICPMMLLDEGHILNIAVHREFRGKGVAKFLMETVIRDCRVRGAAYISLEVRPSNEAAITLYRKFGFVETGIRRKYYENGEDAILMDYLFANNEDK